MEEGRQKEEEGGGRKRLVDERQREEERKRRKEEKKKKKLEQDISVLRGKQSLSRSHLVNFFYKCEGEMNIFE